MDIVFIGSSRFGLKCLEVLEQIQEIQVVGVVTAPEVLSISYQPNGMKNVLHADFVSYCKMKGLPTLVIDKGMRSPVMYSAVREWRPKAFLVVGWYHMLPKEWLTLAPAYGLHASLLPDYSGGAPLVWAMINGENKTGITLYQMDAGIDSGPIVGQIEESINEDDTIVTLYNRIEHCGMNLLIQFLPQLASGCANLLEQDHSRRRIFPQRNSEDGQIDWQKDAITIDRFIRAQTRPYPGAFTTLNGERLIIWAVSRNVETLNFLPGTVIRRDNNYMITCGIGSLVIKTVHYCGKDIENEQLIDLFLKGDQLLGS